MLNYEDLVLGFSQNLTICWKLSSLNYGKGPTAKKNILFRENYLKA